MYTYICKFKQNLVLRFKRRKTPFYAKAIINHENYGGPNNHLGHSNYPGRMEKMEPCLQTSRKRYEDQLLRTWYRTEHKRPKDSFGWSRHIQLFSSNTAMPF